MLIVFNNLFTMVTKIFKPNTSVDESYSHTAKSKSARKRSELIENVEQIRQGNNRLPTPEKVAILELSESFEKRRLGKHQQILFDISQRCREQEVSDLSRKLSTKCNPKKQPSPRNELSFYNTICSMTPRVANTIKPKVTSNQIDIQNHMSTRPAYERSRSHFPAGKVIRYQKKNDILNIVSSAALKSNKNDVSALPRILSDKAKQHNLDFYAQQNICGPDNTKAHRMFDNEEEMENYFFSRRKATPFLTQIPAEQNSSYEKVNSYLESIRMYNERSISGKSGNTYFKNKSDKDSGIYMMVGNQDRRFSPMAPISTRIGSSTLVNNRDKMTVTKTSVTSFL